MKTPTHTAPPVAPAYPILHIHPGQQVAECPHCKGELSKKTPIMKGDENEEVRGRHGVIVAMRIATDPRPKCQHCYGRFELVIHLQNAEVRHGAKDADLVRRLRLTDGKTYKNPKGGWIKIEWVRGNDVSYNCSGSCQWAGGRLRCSRAKMKTILEAGNYLPNAIAMTSADTQTPKENGQP